VFYGVFVQSGLFCGLAHEVGEGRLFNKHGIIHAFISPVDTAAAYQLAQEDRYHFQWWALSLIQANPLGGDAGSKKGKKGADQGVDGVIMFLDHSDKPEKILVQVKSGKVSSRDIRDLTGTVQREKAAMGVLITLEAPTQPMTTEAATAGLYQSKFWGRSYAKIQILTIADLLHGAKVEMPSAATTFKQAPRIMKAAPTQATLFDE
jgi:site-specific DNA-methyltransferase (adenine-specific)